MFNQWRRVTSVFEGRRCNNNLRSETGKALNLPTEVFCKQELFIFLICIGARDGILNTFLDSSWQRMLTFNDESH